jgi:hypothetical protein
MRVRLTVRFMMACALLPTAVAWARDARSEAFRLDYLVAPTCPDERVFVQRVVGRSEHLQLVDTGVGRGSIVVRVSLDESGSDGSVMLQGVGPEPIVRTMRGATCDEVVSGLALILALAIEAQATDEPAPPVKQSPAPELGPLPETLRSTTREPVAALRIGAGATAGFDSWSSPTAAMAFVGFTEIAWRAPLRLVRIGFRFSTAGSSIASPTLGEGATRAATFTLIGARLAACPLSFAMTGQLELFACAGFDLGSLKAAGQQNASLSRPESSRQFWSAAQARLALRWSLRPFLVVDAAGEAGFPLIRHKFIFEGPPQDVYDVPGIGVGADVALVWYFL